MVSANGTNEHKEQVLASPKVRSIREAVGGFEAKQMDVKSVDKMELTATTVKTNLGTLTYAETENGTTGARLIPSGKSDIPEQYRDVPEGTEVALIGHESSVELQRTVTDQEEQQLINAVPVAEEKFVTATYSKPAGDQAGEYTVATEHSQYKVDENFTPIQTGGGVTTQDHGNCTYHCASCAKWAVSKGICYGSCATAASGATAALCVACIAGTNVGLIFSDCDECGSCI
ncbi:hypothetical protein ACT4ML_02835 [Natrinema sp. LN54]|uniref:hypothetical protein n=1 Tax=Natrinema sp. LN54 TaxID=3458705 RepID=UPI004036ED3B